MVTYIQQIIFGLEKDNEQLRGRKEVTSQDIIKQKGDADATRVTQTNARDKVREEKRELKNTRNELDQNKVEQDKAFKQKMQELREMYEKKI